MSGIAENAIGTVRVHGPFTGNPAVFRDYDITSAVNPVFGGAENGSIHSCGFSVDGTASGYSEGIGESCAVDTVIQAHGFNGCAAADRGACVGADTAGARLRTGVSWLSVCMVPGPVISRLPLGIEIIFARTGCVF